MSSATDDTDPAARVRQLLLSGDNVIKNRDNPERFDRARERYVKARDIAAEAGLEASVLAIIDLRLTELPTSTGGTA